MLGSWPALSSSFALHLELRPLVATPTSIRNSVYLFTRSPLSSRTCHRLLRQACSVCHLRKHWCINACITCCYFLESLQRMSSYLCYVGILISLHSTLGSCATKPLTWCSDRVIFVSFVSWVPYKSLYPSIVVAKCMRPLWMRTVFSRVAFWVSVSSA